MEPSNVRKQIKEPPSVTKVYSHVVGTVQCEDRNIKCKKKNKGTTKCDKSTVKCDVGTVEWDNRTIKCEKKIREPPNVTKEQLHVMLKLHNVRMIPSNVRKK